jgi:membrane protein required for colicin V production
MNWVDYVILGLVLFSAIVGLARGLIRELLSLAVWIAALVAAWLYHREVADLLVAQISNPSARLAIAFVGLVLAVLILGAILGAILSALVAKARLTGLDRALGLVFGAARGAVLVSMAVMLAALTPLPDEPWWKESRTIAELQLAADWMLSLIPTEIQDRLKKV